MSTDSKASRSSVTSTRAPAAYKKAASAFERRLTALELQQNALSTKETERPSPWRSPLTIAIAAAAVAAGGNALVSYMNATSQVRLEQVKAEQNLIIEAIKTGGDVDKAAANLNFLVSTGLITDRGRSDLIKAYVRENSNRPDRLPALPSAGQTQPPAPRPRPAEQATGAPGAPPNSGPSPRAERMAMLQLTATPSDGLRSYQLMVDGQPILLANDHRAQIRIAGACGDRSDHRLTYRLIGPAGAKLNVAMSCGGRPIGGTRELEISGPGQTQTTGALYFQL